MKQSNFISRRGFVKVTAGVLSTIPVLATNTVHAGDLQKLAEDDPQAAALGYVADSSTADKSKYPNHEAAQLCSNCSLYQADGDSEWGGCAIFPGKQVAAAGWCGAYAAIPE